MDLEAIERALERCREFNEIVKRSDATDGDHERLFKECMVTVTIFGPGLLRLVRAVKEHNDGCRIECARRRIASDESVSCRPWVLRGRLCQDCSLHDVIELD